MHLAKLSRLTVAACFAVAAPPAAGGPGLSRIASSASGGLLIEGLRTEGGVPVKFEKVVDLRNGFSRIAHPNGNDVALSGYDGAAWNSFNGIVNIIDLPAL